MSETTEVIILGVIALLLGGAVYTVDGWICWRRCRDFITEWAECTNCRKRFAEKDIAVTGFDSAYCPHCQSLHLFRFYNAHGRLILGY